MVKFNFKKVQILFSVMNKNTQEKDFYSKINILLKL